MGNSIAIREYYLSISTKKEEINKWAAHGVQGCKADVPIASAIEGLPCPQCGKMEYVILASDDESSIAISDAKAELLMQRGQWDEAASAYRSCLPLEPSELNLRMATLQWRRDCAQYIDRVLEAPIPLPVFRQDILDRYDTFVADWIVQSYRGIQLVPDGNTYNVVRRNNP